MPYSTLPKRFQTRLRIMDCAIYFALIVMGVCGLVWTPTTIIGTIGEPLTLWWTGLIAVGAAVCLFGVVKGRYRIEWLTIWPTAGGAAIYGLTIWGLVISQGEITRSAQAGALTALALFIARRGVFLHGHAEKLRNEHPQTT